ncbi:hypothetical protein L1987_78063 [Smallanthus sonchifolius]|uniref:Uncharacterized protein n=1 Tax=Smallanthus sonchifolius TaxID=185202 RepID=A0ACB8ZBM4_9ASTR|nr:hypothetical protein L1987_78063 [Smallanthus sonchifolius]
MVRGCDQEAHLDDVDLGEDDKEASEHEEDEGESEYEIDEHDEDDVDLEGDDEEEFEDGPSEETETDEDVQRGKVKKKRKLNLSNSLFVEKSLNLDAIIRRNASTLHEEVLKRKKKNASTQHVGHDNQVSPTLERMVSKSITGDDVGDDDVTTKAPIFDETRHTSKPAEDKSSQSDFTTSMMIEHEIKEAKMLLVYNPTFDGTPQTNKKQREEDKLKEMSQLDFTDSMIVEYDKQEKEILKDRKKETEKVEESE